MATFNIFATLSYEIKQPSTIILGIQALGIGGQSILHESLQISPEVKIADFFPEFQQKRYRILDISKTGGITISYQAVVHTQVTLIPGELLQEIPIAALPSFVLPYLHPSRYCQSDRLYTFAQHQFGHLENPFEKVMAVRDWIFSQVEYRPGYGDAHISAMDTLVEQVGVCRDFSHLGVALCRALDIPARYVSAYAYQLDPPDFHAYYEVYLGGYWVVLDATKLAPVNGLIRIASGMDATETAIASIFGQAELLEMEVSVSLAEESAFVPINAESRVDGYILM